MPTTAQLSKRQEIHHLVFFWTLCVLVASFPYSIAVNRITIIILVANWFFEAGFKRKWEIVKSNVPLILLIVFYLLHAVALLYTDNMREGTSQLEKKISYLAFSVVIVTSLPLSRKQFEFLLKILVVSTIVSSLVCFGYAFHRNHYFETFKDPVWFYWSYYDLTEIIGVQPNYLAIFAGTSIAIIYYFIIEYGAGYSRLKKVFLYAVILYFLGFIILLSGRTALLATVLIIVAGYMWWFYKQKRLLKGMLAVGLSLVVLGVVVYQIPIMRERILQTFGIDKDAKWINQMGDGKGSLASIRLMKWQSSWNIIKENWLLGVSPGDTQEALEEQYRQLNFTMGYEEHFNPHNQFMQAWVALGIIGFIVFVGTLLVPLRTALTQSDYLYIAFIALFAISCTTESVLERQVGIIFYALFNGLFLQRQNNYPRVE